MDLLAFIVGQKIEGCLGAHEGAAQIHQDEHLGDLVLAEQLLDGGDDLGGVGADRGLWQVGAAGGCQGGGALHHLVDQFKDSFGQSGAVGDEDQADHVGRSCVERAALDTVSERERRRR